MAHNLETYLKFQFSSLIKHSTPFPLVLALLQDVRQVGVGGCAQIIYYL